jgi:sulfur carrier protein ThiS
MKDYSGRVEAPNRVVLPVVEKFPDVPLIGEIVFFNVFPHQGMFIFNGEGWIPMYTTINNVWESIEAEKEQKIFELQHQYQTDGKSIVVYKDGRRLPRNAYAEIGPTMFAYKELDEEGEMVELKGGEIFEVQIFNQKLHSVFDVKSFNRRNGVC